MTGKEILGEIKTLNLPPREYTVVGSGSMAVRDIREAADIDLVATQQLYDNLKASGWQETHHPESLREWTITHGNFDVGTKWSVGDYDPDPQDLINTSDLISGVRFVNLPNLLMWKHACRREKDLRDIELIETYLAQQPAQQQSP